ncbi:MAG: hypothetical protein CML68_13590 [Rhodobacteraceae bacterium]|nr:hypothetical protein [Paracoccaceae bacterium]
MFDLLHAPERRPLRDYQAAHLREVYRQIREGVTRVCAVLPTGAGKTRWATEIVFHAQTRGKKVVFTVPAISLVDQTVEAFESEGIERVGVIQADHLRTDPLAPVQVASVQTLAKRGVPAADIVIVDEAHVYAKAVREWMDAEPGVLFIGLTATPGRVDMAKEYQALVEGATTRFLIGNGFLSPYRVFAPSEPAMTGVKTVAGEFSKAQSSEKMQDAKLTADIVQTWLEKGEGRPTLMFCVDRAHAKRMQAEFEAVGVECGYQDAFTKPVERRLIADKFNRGELQVVANVGTLTTGVDWDVRCIILARPTKSKMLHVQILGRALRTAEGKADAIILDHAGNLKRLGFVEDIDWSKLPEPGDRNASSEASEPKPKACKKCTFVMPPKAKSCPNCGHEAPPPSGFVLTDDGELVEVTKARRFSKREKQEFFSGLLWYASDKGYREGWAKRTFSEKFGQSPSGLEKVAAKPNAATKAFIKHKLIKFAKRKGASRG